MLVKIRKKNTDPHPERRVFEWNPGNGKWYRIRRDQIYFRYRGSRPVQVFSYADVGAAVDRLNEEIRRIMTCLLNNCPVSVSASYSIREKRLIIQLEVA